MIHDVVRRRIDLDGVRLAYRRGGDATPVLLLHGFPLSSHSWRNVIPLLAAQHTVLAPDLPGIGDSNRPTGGYDTGTVAATLAEFLERLDVGAAHVVGHDIGGWVGFSLALDRPELVRSLAVLDVYVPGYGLEQMRDRLWHLGFHAEPDLPEALISGREHLYFGYFARRDTYSPGAITTEDLDEYVAAYQMGGLRAALGYYRALDESAAHNTGRSVGVPVLTLAGDHGLGDTVADRLRPACPDLSSVIVQGCGHYLPDEQPSAVAHHLLDHFARHEPLSTRRTGEHE